MHYQAYLLEGLTRWNQDRALAARQELHYRTYNLCLADSVSLWLTELLYSTCWFIAQPLESGAVSEEHSSIPLSSCSLHQRAVWSRIPPQAEWRWTPPSAKQGRGNRKGEGGERRTDFSLRRCGHFYWGGGQQQSLQAGGGGMCSCTCKYQWWVFHNSHSPRPRHMSPPQGMIPQLRMSPQ